MGPLIGWIFIKLVDLINWMADASDRKALGRDIPSPSAQGRADAPRLPDGYFAQRETSVSECRDPECRLCAEAGRRGEEIVEYRVTPDRPDPYLSQVRKQVNQLTGASVAQNYPRGS
jgi:hypothetical protein